MPLYSIVADELGLLFEPDIRKFRVICQKCGYTDWIDLNHPTSPQGWVRKLVFVQPFVCGGEVQMATFHDAWVCLGCVRRIQEEAEAKVKP